MTIEHTDLAGKCILLTGGATGIGRATLTLLARAGARVVTFGRHRDALDEALAGASGDKVSRSRRSDSC